MDNSDNLTVGQSLNNSTIGVNLVGSSIGFNFFKSSLDIYLYFHDNFCPETLCSKESWWTRSRIFVIILSIAALLYLIVVAIILFVFKKKKEKKVEKILQDNTRDLYGDPNKAFQDDFFRAPVKYANESNVPIMQACDFEQDEFPMRFPLQNAQRAQRESDFLPLRPLNERFNSRLNNQDRQYGSQPIHSRRFSTVANNSRFSTIDKRSGSKFSSPQSRNPRLNTLQNQFSRQTTRQNSMDGDTMSITSVASSNFNFVASRPKENLPEPSTLPMNRQSGNPAIPEPSTLPMNRQSTTANTKDFWNKLQTDREAEQLSSKNSLISNMSGIKETKGFWNNLEQETTEAHRRQTSTLRLPTSAPPPPPVSPAPPRPLETPGYSPAPPAPLETPEYSPAPPAPMETPGYSPLPPTPLETPGYSPAPLAPPLPPPPMPRTPSPPVPFQSLKRNTRSMIVRNPKKEKPSGNRPFTMISEAEKFENELKSKLQSRMIDTEDYDD